MTQNTLIWFLIGMVIYFAGTYTSKLYSNTPTNSLFLTPIFLFILVSMCWMKAIKEYGQLAVLGTTWSISCVIVQVFIGVFLFQEQLSLFKWIGIGFGATSIILLSL